MVERTQKGDLYITAWMKWFPECLINALRSTYATLAGVLFKADFWSRHAKTILNQRQEKLLNKFSDGIEGKMTSSKWAKMASCSNDTAIRYINDLMAKGILQKEGAGGRSTNYELKK